MTSTTEYEVRRVEHIDGKRGKSTKVLLYSKTESALKQGDTVRL